MSNDDWKCAGCGKPSPGKVEGYHAGPALSAEDVGTIQAAVENLRSADHDERRTEAAWRIASKLEEIARRANGQAGSTEK